MLKEIKKADLKQGEVLVGIIESGVQAEDITRISGTFEEWRKKNNRLDVDMLFVVEDMEIKKGVLKDLPTVARYHQ